MNAQVAPSNPVDQSSPSDRLDTALDRLRRAAASLEVAMRKRDRSDRSVAALEQELQVLSEDRSRLAHELDQVKSRASRLDAASAEVSGRLDKVMSDLRGMLDDRRP